MPCPFCSPQRIFHTGPLTLGLWDAFPVSPGHALLIPRRHITTWSEATPDEQRELTAAIAIAQQASPKADGFNVGMNLEEAAGQTVQKDDTCRACGPRGARIGMDLTWTF